MLGEGLSLGQVYKKNKKNRLESLFYKGFSIRPSSTRFSILASVGGCLSIKFKIMKKLKIFSYVLHGTWDGGRFEHYVEATDKEAAEKAFRSIAPLHPSVKITEFEIKESYYVYVSE